jgi:hypothetical protein
MLVSSHTISVWRNWDHVPGWLRESVKGKIEPTELDWILLVPKVIQGTDDILKAFDVKHTEPTTTGTMYVGVLHAS